jgi:hypothetical protein
LEPGTYLILSRTLRDRESDNHGWTHCSVAAYYWRLGSKEEPRYITVTNGQDCVGFSVVENALTAWIDGHSQIVDLSGKWTGRTMDQPGWQEPHTRVIGAYRVTTQPFQYAGTSLRITDAGGTNLYTDDFPNWGIQAISKDGNTLYVGATELTDGFMGPWTLSAYDWRTKTATEIPQVANSTFYSERTFDKDAGRILYVTDKKEPDSEGHGWIAKSPSAVHLLDFKTGKDTVLQQENTGETFTKPRFSPDGSSFAIDTPGTTHLYPLIPNAPAIDTVTNVISDWFDDTMIIGQPELQVYDVKTKKTVLLSKDYASFEYVGRIEVR